MRFRSTAIVVAILLITGVVTSWVVAQDAPAPTPSSETTPAKRAKLVPEATIRHVVLFEFKDDAPKEKIAEIEQAFADLPNKIDEIADLEWGLNNSPEGLNDGFSHCFLVTFNSDADRKAYLPHPAHKAFANLLRPYLKEVLVVDYSPKPKGEKSAPKTQAADAIENAADETEE